MENTKRRRGISLVHQQRNNESHQNSQNKGTSCENNKVDIPVPITRVQYNRYHLGPGIQVSRHSSAPKAKIVFSYPIQFDSKPQTRNYQNRSATDAQNMPTNNLSSQNCMLNQEDNYGDLSYNPIKERYTSFQECKQKIGQRLFGCSSYRSRDSQPLSERSNRWLGQSAKASQVSIKEQLPSMPLIQCKGRRKQLQIQKEVFSYKPEIEVSKRQIKVQDAKPVQLAQIKENVAPIIFVSEPKKQNRTEQKLKRNPIKLKQMEQRLMEIIKICDENI